MFTRFSGFENSLRLDSSKPEKQAIIALCIIHDE